MSPIAAPANPFNEAYTADDAAQTWLEYGLYGVDDEVTEAYVDLLAARARVVVAEERLARVLMSPQKDVLARRPARTHRPGLDPEWIG